MEKRLLSIPSAFGYSAIMRRISAPLLLVSALLWGCLTSGGRELAAEYYNIGNGFLELGQYEKAVQYFRDALRLDPALVKADYNLALTYVRLQRIPDARQTIERLLVDDPQNATLLSALAWAYHKEGRDEDALAQYDRLIAVAPENQDALYNSGLILSSLKRNEQALRRFEALLALAPEDSDALFAAGTLLLSMDDPSVSIDYIGRYLLKKPEDKEAYFLLADAHERKEEYLPALQAYEKIAALDARQANAWFGKARLLLSVIEDPVKGLEALQKALELGFNDPEAVKTLLNAESLLEKEKVRFMLQEKKLLPEEPTATPSQ